MPAGDFVVLLALDETMLTPNASLAPPPPPPEPEPEKTSRWDVLRNTLAVSSLAETGSISGLTLLARQLAGDSALAKAAAATSTTMTGEALGSGTQV